MSGRERALIMNGLLTTSESVLYQVEAGTRLYLHALVCQNPAGAEQSVVSLYVCPKGGVSRVWVEVILDPAERMEVSDWLFGELDTLRGKATTTEAVTWTVSGSLESIDV